jgi:hypothetical protein
MLRRSRIFAAAGVAIAAFALAGCAIVDKYSDRAVEYNLQAEKTQQQNLLLNIVRASLRRPMQFTGLTSITGTASASGSVTGGYTNAHQTPYIGLFGPTISTPAAASTQSAITRAVTGTGSGTASMSGGPTFTVPVLDTQEFYSGILAPLTHQIIDYYVKQGFPPQILFDLFVGSVDVIATDSTKCERFTFRNDVRDDVNFGQFQALADYLIGSGFTTERITETRPYGPDIPMPRRPINATEAAAMVDAYTKASAAGLDLRRPRPAAAGRDRDDTSLHLQKRASRYRFCFTRHTDQPAKWLGPPEEQAYCGYASVPRKTPQTRGNRCGIVGGGDQGSGDGGSSQFYDIKLSDALFDRIKAVQDNKPKDYVSTENFFPIRTFRNRRVTFQFNTRSVEGILYYLGEITRQNLRPEFEGASRIAQVKTQLRYGTIPSADCNSIENGGMRETKTDLIGLADRRRDNRPYTCDNLFVLEAGFMSDAFYSVTYDGVTYSIPNDPARHGRTLQVLELVKQLLALHTSAKQLPQSSVISIIGGTAQ